jgi:hypothetical protein
VSEVDDVAPEQSRMARLQIGKDVVGRHPVSPDRSGRSLTRIVANPCVFNSNTM